MFLSILLSLSEGSLLMLKQEAYKSMASALSEADGIIDYTDPEEVSVQSRSCFIFLSFVTFTEIMCFVFVLTA